MCCKKVKTYFNTQPPEGGWISKDTIDVTLLNFNTQPPEGGWVDV